MSLSPLNHTLKSTENLTEFPPLLSRGSTRVSSLPPKVLFLCCVTLFRQGRNYAIDSDNVSRMGEQVANF